MDEFETISARFIFRSSSRRMGDNGVSDIHGS
jgi:hypothetical protein